MNWASNEKIKHQIPHSTNKKRNFQVCFYYYDYYYYVCWLFHTTEPHRAQRWPPSFSIHVFEISNKSVLRADHSHWCRHTRSLLTGRIECRRLREVKSKNNLVPVAHSLSVVWLVGWLAAAFLSVSAPRPFVRQSSLCALVCVDAGHRCMGERARVLVCMHVTHWLVYNQRLLPENRGSPWARPFTLFVNEGECSNGLGLPCSAIHSTWRVFFNRQITCTAQVKGIQLVSNVHISVERHSKCPLHFNYINSY